MKRVEEAATALAVEHDERTGIGVLRAQPVSPNSGKPSKLQRKAKPKPVAAKPAAKASRKNPKPPRSATRPVHAPKGVPANARGVGCRSCGSKRPEDFAPSFVKRNDRRCKKCFAKIAARWAAKHAKKGAR